MRTYLLRRLLLVPVTLLGITLISFLMIHLAPGDPASLKRHGMSEGAKAAADAQRGTEDAIKAFRARHHLDKPLYEQYGRWLWDVARLDLGRTYFGNNDVWEEMKPHLLRTLGLEAAAMLLIFAVAIPLGIYSAWRPESRFDQVSAFVLFVLYSLPVFWTATMLIIVFGNREHAPLGIWFPVSGLWDDRLVDASPWEKLVDLLRHTFLPVVCLSYGTLAVVSRYMRAGMLEVIRQDFVRTARAKGLPEKQVVLKHALRNALFPIVTLAASLLPAVVAGSIIVEVVFQIPGMGWWAYDAIQRREYDILMATFLLSGIMELVALFVADVTYALLDPRVSFEGAAA